ncbi:MAG: zinc-ribbon domain-containing protein, partial [Leptolinea sp.]|nr:zinc-ribbon domain-containing protein [Leptolinea sp.]
MSEKLFCRFCGTEIQADSMFCPHCGKPVPEAGGMPASTS